MIQYKYHRTGSLDDAVKTLREYGRKVRIVAGGTDIMVQIHEQDKRWKDLECLLDITSLEYELRYVSEADEYIYIGSLATHTDIENSDIIAEHIPFLGWACASVGSPQIRNRGTLGGSIGNALPASDPLPALIAADAFVGVYGPEGERTCLLKDFYEGKGDLKLKEGEFIEKFIIKKLPYGTKMSFSKLGRRKALAVSRLNCAAALSMEDDGTIIDARIAPGCIFVLPDRVGEAEKVIIGLKPSEELFKKAGATVAQTMIERTGNRWSTRYKEPVVQEIVLRALCQAAGMEV